MQLWCPNGHVLFIQGWQLRSFFRLILCLFIHCEVSKDRVGPNIDTVGILKLAAMCIGPLSPVTNKSNMEIFSITSEIEVRPARFLKFLTLDFERKNSISLAISFSFGPPKIKISNLGASSMATFANSSGYHLFALPYEAPGFSPNNFFLELDSNF